MRIRIAGGVALAMLVLGVTVETQSSADAHIASARAASGNDFGELLGSTCDLVKPPTGTPAPATSTANPAVRSTWHVEPAKVFDNLYFVGQSEYSAWAITTSAGIILMDAIYDYSVEDEVVNGLKTLGLDPAQIKYVVISHAHADHAGGAGLLQKRGARIVMSATDWDLLDATKVNYAKPTRDVVATDGQKLTLGDTTVTLYLTPGHTLGTISSIIPLKDGSRQHVAAYWGGTAFNWLRGPAAYITPERPPRFWFTQYAASAKRFRDVAGRANADVFLSNHSSYDGSRTKIPALAHRAAGAPHPYVVGKDAVRRFLTVADECAQAGLATTTATR
jgi:metallo-beta-lactamase class B